MEIKREDEKVTECILQNVYEYAVTNTRQHCVFLQLELIKIHQRS